MFALTLKDMTWNRSSAIMNGIQDMAILKEKSLRDLTLGTDSKRTMYTLVKYEVWLHGTRHRTNCIFYSAKIESHVRD